MAKRAQSPLSGGRSIPAAPPPPPWIKASYSAAEAETHISEALTGISEEMGDVGMAMQRAQDKSQRLAPASAPDELIDSGALEDGTLPAGRDDIQAQLDAATQGHGIWAELARMKARLNASASPASLEAEEKPAASAAGPTQEPPEKEPTSR